MQSTRPLGLSRRALSFFASFGISLSATDAKHRANVDVRLSIAALPEIYDVQGGPDNRRLSFRTSRIYRDRVFGAGPFLGEHAMGGRRSRVVSSCAS